MTGRRRTRELTADELELWRVVTASVVPRNPRRVVPAAPKSPAVRHEALAEHRPADRRAPAVEPQHKPLVDIDRRMKRELAKGRLEIDARLDLHGYRAAEAHTRVVDFLANAQRNGVRVALIVTGKGGRPSRMGEWSGEHETGVLKRQTPMWLADPRLRHIVAAFGEASQPHGGAGALYVRIRRRQEAR